MFYFDHERLTVYQVSIDFVAWAGDLIESVSKKAAVKDQLDRASTSVSLNIAEGNGKSSLPDRKRFFEISRGSALECAACLDIFVARKFVKEEIIRDGKVMLSRIVSMLYKLAESYSSRIGEEEAEYLADAGNQSGE